MRQGLRATIKIVGITLATETSESGRAYPKAIDTVSSGMDDLPNSPFVQGI